MCGNKLKICNEEVRAELDNLRKYMCHNSYSYLKDIRRSLKSKIEVPSELYNISINCLNSPTRSWTCLRLGSIDTVGILLEKIYKDISWYCGLRNMGKVTVATVYISLIKNGFANKNILQNLVECGLYTQEELQELIEKEFN